MAGVARENASTRDLAAPLDRAAELMRAAVASLKPRMAQDPAEIGGASNDFLQLTGYSVYAYLWVRMAVAALNCNDSGFAEAKQKTARFYLTRVFPRAESHALAIEAGAASVMDLDDALF